MILLYLFLLMRNEKQNTPFSSNISRFKYEALNQSVGPGTYDNDEIKKEKLSKSY